MNEKTLGEAGLGELIDILKNELGDLSVPTITIALNQVVGQSPLQIQLTQAQYDALASSQVAVIDATALQIDWLNTIVKTNENDSNINFRATIYDWRSDGSVATNTAFAFNILKSTKILTMHSGYFYEGIYSDTSGWIPGSGHDSPATPEFVMSVFTAYSASATNITSGSTLPADVSDNFIRSYITYHLPIRINGALCHYMDENTTTNIVRYFTATMNGALVHLNIIEINTSTWVVTFNQVDVNSGGGGGTSNVDQDLTGRVCFTLNATDYASLVSTHTATVASPDFTGLSNTYEFVTIKITIYTSANTSTNYNIKLCRNDTGKYSGLFFIEDSSHLYELTLYYNGTSVYLRCATVY